MDRLAIMRTISKGVSKRYVWVVAEPRLGVLGVFSNETLADELIVSLYETGTDYYAPDAYVEKIQIDTVLLDLPSHSET